MHLDTMIAGRHTTRTRAEAIEIAQFLYCDRPGRRAAIHFSKKARSVCRPGRLFSATGTP
eukprot:scaffold3575_cov107-Isochrysis_galbana.AAC.2